MKLDLVPLGSDLVPADLVPGSPPPERGRGEMRTGNKSQAQEPSPGTESGTKSGTPYLTTSTNGVGGSGDPTRGDYCTPKWLADLIGPWDLDPCSNERSHIAAGRAFSLKKGQDGLEIAKSVSAQTRVFCNPPYEGGSVARWISAYAHTRFCFLLRFDPSTRWFGQLYELCELIAIPQGRRVNFEPPPGVKASSQTFPHALFYRRYVDVTPDVLRACITWRPYTSHAT